MTTPRQILTLLTEAIASARAQPVASVLAAIIVAGMCAAVFLTTGRSVGAEHAVVATIDDEGTRSIVVRAEADAGLDASVVERIRNIHGIAWAGAFGFPRDVTNAAIGPGGDKVALRELWTTRPGELGIPGNAIQLASRPAWASPDALTTLGMVDAAGGLITTDGIDYSVLGELTVPDFLSDLTPTVVAPATTPRGDVSTLVVIAAEPDLVGPVGTAIAGLLDVRDSTKITVTTSETLAQLREAVRGQLGAFGRELVMVIFAVSAGLVAAVQYGLVSLRRKDYGRRRALGASRSLIVSLILLQVACISLAGAVLGTGISLTLLLADGDPLPSPQFFAAIDLLAIAVAVGAATWPAIFASRRDPARELRVP